LTVAKGFNPRPSLLTDESKRQPSPNELIKRFQSTSVIADGRIRPESRVSQGHVWFQSTSVIADGRILASLVDVHDVALFQSTSVIADGRIRTLVCKPPRRNPVSIHVRHC